MIKLFIYLFVMLKIAERIGAETVHPEATANRKHRRKPRCFNDSMRLGSMFNPKSRMKHDETIFSSIFFHLPGEGL
jgi:hypothetical protein